MKIKLILKKTFIFAIAIISFGASQAILAMTTTALRTAGTASKNLYKATPKRAYHADLGVGPNATKAQVDAAYRQLAKKYHPDVNKNPGASEQMKKINNARDKAQATNYASAEELKMHTNSRSTGYDYNSSSGTNGNAGTYTHDRNKSFWENVEAEVRAQGAAHGKSEAEINKAINQVRIYWENTKGVGHALYTIPILTYFANKADKLEFQDDLYNSHMEPISQENDLTSNTHQQDSTITKPIVQENQPAPSMWAKIAENSAELINQNPAITAIAAAAIISTAAFYAYKYITAPTEEDYADKYATALKQEKAKEEAYANKYAAALKQEKAKEEAYADKYAAALKQEKAVDQKNTQATKDKNPAVFDATKKPS